MVRVVDDKESIKRYITDFYKYKKSIDIESVYILLYIRENRNLLKKVKLVSDSFIIKDNDYIELSIKEYEKDIKKFIYVHGETVIDNNSTVLLILKEHDKNSELPIYIRIDVNEIDNLVANNEDSINLLCDEDIEEINEEYLEIITNKELVKIRINQLLDNYNEDYNDELKILNISLNLLLESELTVLGIMNK